jgi:type I site-specific restriction endonuclease
VLEYFDAFIIGLTATPSKQTLGFFHNNLVMEYGHERAVADGVNVGYDRELNETDRKGIENANNGEPFKEIINNLFNAFDPDKKIEKAKEMFNTDIPTEEN